MICPLSPAHFFALGAFQLSALLLFINVTFAPLPLIIFVLLCFFIPLFPSISFFLPIISRGKKGLKGVSLTFDDGPDPAVTPLLLKLLKKEGVTATFFVTGVRSKLYPEIIRLILADGHTVGNHSYHHSPFLMLKGLKTLQMEIETLQNLFLEFGIIPLAFRPPVGITSSRLWRILLKNGMFCVNFSCRAADFGNRRVIGISNRILAKVVHGDIILLHDVSPRDGGVTELLKEFSTLIHGLKGRGIEIIPLNRLIGKDVMQYASTAANINVAEQFYNGLAESYDNEQFNSAVSLSRTTEQQLFSDQIPKLFTGVNRVLEIGAGTGIFTLDIAQHCREVTAVDISSNMLKILEKKAAAAGVTNIKIIKGNVEHIEFNGLFSVACAFLSLEYLVDLPAFFKKLARHIEPGGAIYFVIARSSLLRLITQVGNAMRQGLWLRAYSKGEIEAMLTSAGFERITISSHLLKSIFSGGMLFEVVAYKSANDGSLT